MFTDKIELKDFDKMAPEYKDILGHVLTIQADCEIDDWEKENGYEEELDESAEEDLDESAEEDLDEAEEMDESAMGGDAQDDLIDEVETDEEQDMSMEGEGDDMGGDEGGSEPATKDDIMDLEAKLDELMAEFETHMGGDEGGDGDDFGPEEGGDAIEVDDTEEMMPMAEAISLKQVHPKTTTSEEGDGKAGPVAFNAGARGMASKPVKTTGGDSAEGPHDTAAYRNSTKDLIGKVGNSPAQGTQNLKPATKPHLGQASGVNNKSPLPKV